MAINARASGKDGVAFWGTEATQLGDLASLNISEQQDTADVTAMGDGNKQYVQTIEDLTITATILDQGTGNPVSLYSGLGGTLLWAPRGTADGAPAYQIQVFVQSYDDNTTYSDGIKHDVTFKPTGDWTAHYRELGSTWSSGTISP